MTNDDHWTAGKTKEVLSWQDPLPKSMIPNRSQDLMFHCWMTWQTQIAAESREPKMFPGRKNHFSKFKHGLGILLWQPSSVTSLVNGHMVFHWSFTARGSPVCRARRFPSFLVLRVTPLKDHGLPKAPQFYTKCPATLGESSATQDSAKFCSIWRPRHRSFPGWWQHHRSW